MPEGEVEQNGVSKSAKRRAAKKAAVARAEAEAEPVKAPEPEAKAKAKAKAAPKEQPAPPAAEPKAKAKAKAKGEAKAESKAEPKVEPKAEPKQAATKPKAEAKPAAKAAGKPAAKAKAEVKQPEAPPPRKESGLAAYYEMDDGTGDAWEQCTGVSKQKQKRKERVEAEEAAKKAAEIEAAKEAAIAAARKRADSNVAPVAPVAPPADQQRIPGMSAAPVKAAASTAATATTTTAAAAPAVPVAEVTQEKAKEPDNQASDTVRVPDTKIGVVIGPKGSKINMIKEKTGASRIDVSGDLFTISGTPEAVALAKSTIEELIEKGYTALAYDDFSEIQIPVHPGAFPSIIGKGGAVIFKLRELYNVEMQIPKTPPKAAESPKKYKVTVAGAPADVEKAKCVIEDILMYYHHEDTHPGLVHDELEVTYEDPNLRFLIGRAGSELRHIQNNYKVTLNIPRENSANKHVVLVGEQDGVARAKLYIDKLLSSANQPKGRGSDGAADGDTWGDEAPEEEWMKAYMKRK